MPLPSSLKHINAWLLEDGDGWTVVDTGICSTRLQDLWDSVSATQLADRPVKRVIATHLHSDHVGLAHWLCQRFGAGFWISEPDYRRACELILATSESFGESATRHLIRHGVTDPALLDSVRRQPTPYPALVPALPALSHPIVDGEDIRIGGRSWCAIAGYGHAPEHMALYCRELRILLAGDMLLPRISTYVGVSAQDPAGNPLPAFLASLDRFLDLPDDTLVLPSHGEPFTGIAVRVAELRAHHGERLEAVRRACRRPTSAAELVPQLFLQPLDQRNFALALGETLAHLHALVADGQLDRTQSSSGDRLFFQSCADE